jgi:hypothetical protein
MRYGKRETFRLLYCRTCRARFSERKGTPLFNARLPTDRAAAVLEHLNEGCGVRGAGCGVRGAGCGVRQTGRLTRVSRGAVGRLCRVAGGHAEAAHGELVAFSPADGGTAVRREVVARRQEAGELRPSRPPARAMSGSASTGTTWRWTRSTGWCRPWCRASGRRPTAGRPWPRPTAAPPHRRTGGRLGRVPRLITGDEYPSYKPAVADVYGRRAVPLPVLPRRGGGRPRGPRKVVPAGLSYAAARKRRDGRGRVTRVEREVVFGTEASVAAALRQSAASRSVNTAFLERHHATDRHRNARKARATYRLSKAPDAHASMTYFTAYSYNFCHPVRTLAERPDEHGCRRPRTPAMAAGLAGHVWSIREWVTLPAVQSG